MLQTTVNHFYFLFLFAVLPEEQKSKETYILVKQNESKYRRTFLRNWS